MATAPLLPNPTTLDLSAADLATLLANTVDPTQAANLETWAANHLPADGLTPVEDFTGPISVTSLQGCSTLRT